MVDDDLVPSPSQSGTESDVEMTEMRAATLASSAVAALCTRNSSRSESSHSPLPFQSDDKLEDSSPLLRSIRSLHHICHCNLEYPRMHESGADDRNGELSGAV